MTTDVPIDLDHRPSAMDSDTHLMLRRLSPLQRGIWALRQIRMDAPQAVYWDEAQAILEALGENDEIMPVKV